MAECGGCRTQRLADTGLFTPVFGIVHDDDCPAEPPAPVTVDGIDYGYPVTPGVPKDREGRQHGQDH